MPFFDSALSYEVLPHCHPKETIKMADFALNGLLVLRLFTHEEGSQSEEEGGQCEVSWCDEHNLNC